MQEVENIQGMTSPYNSTAVGLQEAGAQPNIGQYYGAESAGVLPQLENIFGQQMSQTTGNLQQQAGGIGDDRIAVAQAELANQQGLSAGQTLSQIMQQAVGQSQSGAQLEQQAGTNIANIGNTAQSEALTGATAELQSGTLAQQQLQNQQNAQYENVLQGISWPFQTNQYLGSMAAGVTPAMGGTGITSGNTKSSMVNSSGLGKGMTALGAGSMANGGSVPWNEQDASAFDDVDAEQFAAGGSVDPIAIGMGNAAPLAMAGGGSPWGPMTPGGQFTPASGSTVSVPFSDAMGGPQSLMLADSGVPPPPNVHAPQMNLPTSPSGAEGLNIRGPQGAPSFSNSALSQGSDNPFSGLLNGLYQERNSLMGMLGGAGGTGGGSAGGWASGIPAMAGGWGAAMAAAHHAEGGRTPFAPGGEVPIGQQQSSGAEVGNLLGQNSNGENPAGGKTVVPQTTVHGRPSPQQQWATQYRGPNPMSLSQGAGGGGGGGGQNPFNGLLSPPRFTQDAPPQPSAATMNQPGQTLAAPGMGGKGDPTPPLSMPSGNSAPPSGNSAPPADGGNLSPQSGNLSPFSVGDLGVDGGTIFAADGGAMWPAHMDIGGDPLSGGMSMGASPFSPQGEISQSVLPFNIQSGIYDQPYQMAGLTLTGDATQGSTQPVQPDQSSPQQGTLNQQNPSYTGPQLQGGQGQPGVNAPDFKPFEPTTQDLGAYYGRPGYRGRGQIPAPQADQQQAPTPPLSIPPTADTQREQQAIGALGTAAAKPVSPPAQPPTAANPQGGGPAPHSAATQPQPPALAQMPVSQIAKQVPQLAPYADRIPDANMPAGQWVKAHADLLPQIEQYLPPQMKQQLDQLKAGPPTAAAAPPAAGQRDTSWVPQGRPIGSVIVPMDAAKYAIGKFESGNNYSNVTYSYTRLGRALGRYQVMEGELQADLKNAGLPPMTPEQFLRDHGAQDRVFEHKFGGAMQRFGNFNDAASEWLTGRPLATAGDRADRFGTTAAKYVANTQAGLKEYAGGAGSTEQNISENVSRGTGPVGGEVARTAANYGPPPGMPPVNKVAATLMALGTGDPAAYYKTRLAELGLYQASANWDAARNQQYGSMTPQQAGAGLLNEADATRKVIGAVGGAEEQSGAAGTVTHAGASGDTSVHPGASVQPAGGAPVPPAGAGPGAAPPQGGGAPMAPTDEAVARLERGLASGNPTLAAQSAATLNAMAQRGNIQAETALKNAQAAMVGWMPRGNTMINPVQGREWMPGMPAPSAPGSPIGGPPRPPAPNPATVAGPGAGPPASGPDGAGGPPSAGPPSAVSPGAGAAPGAGTPQPLPTGAGPETMRPQPPAAAPGALPATGTHPLTGDRAFRAQPIPRQPPENIRDYAASPAVYDKALEGADAEIAAARQSDTILLGVEREYAGLGKSGMLTPGFELAARTQIMSAINTLMRAAGGEGIANNELGSAQGLEKLQTQLATGAVKGLGREPGYILQMLKSSMVPGGQMNPKAFQQVIAQMHAMNQRAFDHGTAMKDYVGTYMTNRNFEATFDQVNPPQKYDYMAELDAARGPAGQRMNSAVLDNLRRNPAAIGMFSQAWGVRPEAAQWVLQH